MATESTSLVATEQCSLVTKHVVIRITKQPSNHMSMSPSDCHYGQVLSFAVDCCSCSCSCRRRRCCRRSRNPKKNHCLSCLVLTPTAPHC